MRIRRLFLTLASTAVLLAGIPAFAADGAMVLEGTITDADGNHLVDGTHLVDVALHTTENGGTPAWREIHDDVLVTDGAYSITLGSRTPLELPPGAYWAQITVDGEVLEPRTKLTLADGDCTITGDLLVSGEIAVGATSPNTAIEVVGDDTAGGAATFRSSYGPSHRSWFGEMKFTGADGLVLNSQTGGSFSEIRFQNNGTTNMFLKHDGKLGIGTDAPGATLQVEGTSRFGDWSTPPTIQGGKMQIHNLSGNGNSLLVTSYSFGTEATFLVTGSGHVGIGNGSPTHLLDVGTSGAYCNGGTWVNGSSRSYKDNIAELTHEVAYAALAALRPTSFTYKTDPTELSLGFIAEDVPDLVATSDRKGVATMDIVAVLTRVVQAQQEQLETIRQELDALRERPID